VSKVYTSIWNNFKTVLDKMSVTINH